jgi:hypothetical protein
MSAVYDTSIVTAWNAAEKLHNCTNTVAITMTKIEPCVSVNSLTHLNMQQIRTVHPKMPNYKKCNNSPSTNNVF